MKSLSRIYDSPFKFGSVVFGLIFLLGSLLGLILGFLILLPGCQPQSPSDPCDGPAMAAVAFWFIFFWGSLILGIVVGLFSAVVLICKRRRLP